MTGSQKRHQAIAAAIAAAKANPFVPPVIAQGLDAIAEELQATRARIDALEHQANGGGR